ncbi:uncharacterized protein V6R79_021605 [Siganus canaliculatus]
MRREERTEATAAAAQSGRSRYENGSVSATNGKVIAKITLHRKFDISVSRPFWNLFKKFMTSTHCPKFKVDSSHPIIFQKQHALRQQLSVRLGNNAGEISIKSDAERTERKLHELRADQFFTFAGVDQRRASSDRRRSTNRRRTPHSRC